MIKLSTSLVLLVQISQAEKYVGSNVCDFTRAWWCQVFLIWAAGASFGQLFG